MNRTALEAIWSDYDVREAFCYLTGDQQSPGPLNADHIREIVAQSAGENDGPDWIAVGWLTNGEAFLLVAGCDYTGWDCQANGWSNIGPTMDAILHPWLVPDDVRTRLRDLGLTLLDTCEDAPIGARCHNTTYSGPEARQRYLDATS